MIDFNREALHCALYQHEFETIPNFSEIASISPFILHVPVDARTLLRDEDLHLVGTTLSREDFTGYMVYLEEMEVPEQERNELAERLITFSHQPPLALHLRLAGEELVIEERK